MNNANTGFCEHGINAKGCASCLNAEIADLNKELHDLKNQLTSYKMAEEELQELLFMPPNTTLTQMLDKLREQLG